MTDLEITRLCAEAMGIKEVPWNTGPAVLDVAMPEGCIHYEPSGTGLKKPYWPLHDDAQAMALVKHFQMDIKRYLPMQEGAVGKWEAVATISGWDKTSNADLNRAICECVAKIQETT